MPCWFLIFRGPKFRPRRGPVTEAELQMGLAFLAAGDPPGGRSKPSGLTRWEQYAQVLLSANEFLYMD